MFWSGLIFVCKMALIEWSQFIDSGLENLRHLSLHLSLVFITTYSSLPFTFTVPLDMEDVLLINLWLFSPQAKARLALEEWLGYSEFRISVWWYSSPELVSHMIGNEKLIGHTLVNALKEQCKTLKIWKSETDLKSCCLKQIGDLIFLIQSEFSHVFINSLKIAWNCHVFFHLEVHLFNSFPVVAYEVVFSFSLIEDCD